MDPTTTDTETIRDSVLQALYNVYDPELGVNVVDLGLIYDIAVQDDRSIILTMTLTPPGCPMHASIGDWVSQALQTVPDITGGEIRIVWDPPWTPSRLTPAGRRELGYPD
jgi:metal-sulfur cluster biosynthetic enzyme